MPDQIITVESIVRKALVEMGADGLVSPHGECGCDLSDLAPCGEFSGDCRPAWTSICPRCGEKWHWTTRSDEPRLCGDCQARADVERILTGEPQPSTPFVRRNCIPGERP